MTQEKNDSKEIKTEKWFTTRDELTEFLLYAAPNGNIRIEISIHNESIWFTQKRMMKLLGVQRPAITKHLKNIFGSGELDENVVSSILDHTT